MNIGPFWVMRRPYAMDTRSRKPVLANKIMKAKELCCEHLLENEAVLRRSTCG